MRLGIDLRHVPTDGSPGAGVSHASLELAEVMEKMGSEWGIECVLIRGQMRSWKLAHAIKQKKIDALFCASGAVPPFVPVPFYPWVHDVAIFKHPEWFPQSKFKRFITTTLFLRGIRKARHVFAVSEDSKDTLLGLAGISSDRVTVTHQGIKIIQTEPETKYGEYALIVGTIEPRKNIPFIIDLWEEVRAATKRDLKLVIAGKAGWGNIVIPERDWLIRVDAPSDEERDRLYAGASVLLMPSLYEGFGRMALEAMTLGTAVIASNRGAIPEVVEGSGLLLDPINRNGWIKAIRDILTQEQLRTALIAGGKIRAKSFTWEKTARIILAKIAEDW